MIARRAVCLALAALGVAPVIAAQTPARAGRSYPDSINAVGESLDEIRAKGRLKVALYDDFQPFSFRRAGRPCGIDVDLARLIAAELGLRLEIIAITTGETVDDDLRNYLWRGPAIGARQEGATGVDAVANLMLHVPYDRALEVRNELVVLFSPYHEERLAIARDPAAFEGEFSLYDLDGKAVAVELDTLSDFYLSSAWGGRLGGQLRRFRRPDDALDALLAGKVAAFMGALSLIEAGLGGRRAGFDYGMVDLPGLPRRAWPVGAAVRENARDLRWAAGDVIDAAARDGRLAAIFASHGVSHRTPAA